MARHKRSNRLPTCTTHSAVRQRWSLLITLDPQAQRWVGYFGTGDRGSSADKVLTDDLGIIAVMTAAVSVQLSGDALGTNGSSSITLHPGMNLVGVPLNDSRITRVSDLLGLEGMNEQHYAGYRLE